MKKLLLLLLIFQIQTVIAFDMTDAGSVDIWNEEMCGENGANIYNTNGNKAGSVLICLMYVCSREMLEYEDRVRLANGEEHLVDAIPSHCQFWQRLTGKIDIGREMQDLKDYIALKELEKAKYKAIKMVEPVPQRGEQIYSGVKLNILSSQVHDTMDCANQAFAANNFSNNPSQYLNTTGCSGMEQSVENDYVIEHLKEFCSVAEERKNLCVARKVCRADQTPEDCEANPPIDLPFDLMASSLMRYNTFPNMTVKEGAKRFIENLLQSAIPENVDPNDIFLDVDQAKQGTYIFKNNGDKVLANKYQGVALLSIAHSSLFRMYAERIGNTGEFESEGYKGQSVGQSYLGTLAVESKRRYTDPDWHTQISKSSDTSLLREMSNMYALQLKLNYRMSQHLERLEAIMAVKNAYMTNKLIGGLEAARQGAAK